MRLRFEKKLIKMGEDFELPDYSYNHYYQMVNTNEAEIYYLVPSSKADAEKAMSPKSQKESP